MTKVNIRRLNDDGIREFHSYIAGGATGIPPHSVLADHHRSEDIGVSTSIDLNRAFKDRYEIARYVIELVPEAKIEEHSSDAGFWSWFALAYIDQFKGIRLSREEHYIYNPHRHLHYRHCVATPVQLVLKYGMDARLFLSDSMGTMGEMLEQCMSRQYLMRSQNFVEVIRDLYEDPDTKAIKKGVASKVVRKRLKTGKWSTSGAGSIRRLALEFRRLLLTYNIEDMAPPNIIGLLGREYDAFRPRPHMSI